MDDKGLSKPTAAPSEYEFKGEKLLLYPLRWQDWGRIEEWIRTKIIAASAAVVAQQDGLTRAQEKMLMQTANEEATRISITECFFSGEELAKRAQAKLAAQKDGKEVDLEALMQIESIEKPIAFLQSFEGMLRVVHQSLRRGKPTLTLDELEIMLDNDFVALAAMYNTAFRLSFAAPKSEEEVAEDSDPSTAKSADV